MSLIALTKTLGDLCFYFSVISVLPILFTHEVMWLWPALVCAAGTGVAALIHEWAMARCKTIQLRYLAIVFPLWVLTMASSTMELVILAPVAVYTVLVIHGGIYSLEYFKYRNSFQYSMILWGIVFVICFLIESLARPFDGQLRFHYEGMIAYGLVYGACAVFLLRHLRMGLSNNWKRSALNGGELVSVGIIAGIGSVVIFGVWALYRYFRGPINGFFSGILSVFMLISVMVEQSLSEGIQSMDWSKMNQQVQQIREENKEFLDAPLTEEAPLLEMLRENPLMRPADSIPWWLVILIVGILAFALWKMLSVYMKSAPVVTRASVRGTTQIEVPVRHRDRRSPREKVRRCYRDFLKMMEYKGFEREKYHTSEDILEAASQMVSPEAATALRQVYIAARYDETGKITDEQVKQARKALKELKEHK